MSSIFGFVNTNQKPAEEALLEMMRRKLAYWDADFQGKYINGVAGLGNLSLYNTVEAVGTQQPLTDPDSSFTITADVRIDNRAELFAILGIPKSRHGGISDTELVLKCYFKWGKDCPEHLLGDFAFAIWDPAEQLLFCARDPLGIKSLFYYHKNDRFIFSSEIKGILALPGIETTIDNQWLVDCIVMLVPDRESTLYKNIYRMPPAHAMTVKGGETSTRRYWELGPAKKIHFKEKREYAEAMREQLFRAVECRLRSPKAVSSELSGGLDSSIITSVAHNLLHKQGKEVLSYSHALNEKQFQKGIHPKDESDIIDQFIQQVGLSRHQYVTSEGLPFLDTIDSAMLHLDEPLKVSFNLWGSLIHQKAHQQGAGVLMSGLGGDEVITYRGIAAYQKELWTKSKWKFLWDTMMSQSDQNHLRAGKKLVRFLIDQSKNKGSQVPLPAFLFDYLPLTEDYLGQNDLEKRWLKGKRNAYGSVFEQQMTKLGGTSLFDRLENGSLLLKQYKMEYRYPLLDVKLLEFCLALPAEEQLHHGQRGYLVKKALADILPGQLYEKKNNNSYAIPYAYDWVISDKTALLNFSKEVSTKQLLSRELDFNYIESSIKGIEDELVGNGNPMPSIRALVVLRKMGQIFEPEEQPIS